MDALLTAGLAFVHTGGEVYEYEELYRKQGRQYQLGGRIAHVKGEGWLWLVVESEASTNVNVLGDVTWLPVVFEETMRATGVEATREAAEAAASAAAQMLRHVV